MKKIASIAPTVLNNIKLSKESLEFEKKMEPQLFPKTENTVPLHITTPFEEHFTNQVSLNGLDGNDEKHSKDKRKRANYTLLIEWIKPTKQSVDKTTQKKLFDHNGNPILETHYTYRGDDQLKYAKLARKRTVTNEIEALESVLRDKKGKYLTATIYNNLNPFATRVIYKEYNDMPEPEINELRAEKQRLTDKLLRDILIENSKNAV